MSDSEGFLAPSLTGSIAYIRKTFAPWFGAAMRFNALGMQVLPNAKAGTTDNQQLIASALYGRSLTSFQGTLILSERGMVGDARTIVRAAAETAIVLAAVAKDAAVCDLLIDRHFWHHRKLRNAWLNDPEAVAQMTPEQIAAVKATITDADADYPKAKTLTSDPVSIATLAQNASATALYNAIYRSTSGDAAHTSIDALNRHIRADNEANVAGMKFGPDLADLAATVSDAMSVLGHALYIVVDVFALKQFGDELAQCIAVWKALGIPGDYKPGP